MTDQQTISDPETGPVILADPETGPALRTWLLAHGIDPYDVPSDAQITVQTHPRGGPRLAYEVLLKDRDGKHFITETGGPHAREARTTALIIRPPDCLLPQPQAAAADDQAALEEQPPAEASETAQ